MVSGCHGYINISECVLIKACKQAYLFNFVCTVSYEVLEHAYKQEFFLYHKLTKF